MPVKVGVLLDHREQDVWVSEALTQVLGVPGATLGAVAIVELPARDSMPGRVHRTLESALDTRRCGAHRFFTKRDLISELGINPLEVRGTRRDGEWALDDAALAALASCGVDVWLCLAAGRPQLLGPIARLGVWGLEVGDGVPATAAWAGATEVAAGCAVTMTTVVDYAGASRVLYRSFGATETQSATCNRLKALRKGVGFFRRLVEGMAATGALPEAARTLGVPAGYPAQPQPTVSALGRLSSRVVSRRLAKRVPSIGSSRQWQIAYYFASSSDEPFRFDRLRYLVPPRDRFWADPIAVERDGRYYVFFEELLFRTQRGRIGVIEVFENADPGAPQIVFERPYHLSYPFVFSWGADVYMMPETAANRTIEVYRALRFPYQWELHTIVRRDVDAFDATLWHGEDRWWMFVNVAEPGADPCDELHLYWAATPLGPWTAHPSNPVVSDVRAARPAGPLFRRGGALYRPSQDDSAAYGHGVVVNRIDVLNEQEYREIPVERVVADWRPDILRVHTLGEEQRLRVVDCMVRRSRW